MSVPQMERMEQPTTEYTNPSSSTCKIHTECNGNPVDCYECECVGERVEPSPIINAPRQRYLDSLHVDALPAHAAAILAEMEIVTTTVNKLNDAAQRAEDAMDIEEGRLITSEAYAAGKNEATRKAWLTLQRHDDPAFWRAIGDHETAQRNLANAETRLAALGREYQLALAEIRLASSRLVFLAGE